MLDGDLGSYRESMRLRHYFKEWREFRGLTQERLADRVGRDKTHISKLENGKKPYKQADLEGLTVALNCTVGDLFNPPPDPKHPKSDLERYLRKLRTKEDFARAARIMAAVVGEEVA